MGLLFFDGKPEQLTEEALTTIYGEEDWSATIEKVEEEQEELSTNEESCAGLEAVVV